jgi:hypothetical protein
MPLQATSGAASYDAFGGGVAVVPTYIEDVMSVWLYTGNGSTQTITNGIDLAGKGGLTWIKARTQPSFASNHTLFDTVRGTGKQLFSDLTSAQATDNTSLTAFNSTGFTLGSDGTGTVNYSGHTFVSWTFREQPKFFDVVAYMGTGSARTVAHNLGSAPGCIIVKNLASGSWYVYHRSTGNTGELRLNATDAVGTSATAWNSTDPTSTVFSLGASAGTNANGASFVAYLFAHNAAGFGLTGTDNVISCGSYTGNGSATGPLVTLGYEPQWVMVKQSSASGQYWNMIDVMRGFDVSTGAQTLGANASDAELTNAGFGSGTPIMSPTATGFQVRSAQPATNASGATYIYIAIRRGPMRVPTDATKVFKPVTYSGNDVDNNQTTNFPVDLGFVTSRDATTGFFAVDRLRGPNQWPLDTWQAAAESTLSGYIGFDSNTQFKIINNGIGRLNSSARTYVLEAFQRAPGFFDEVCFTQTTTSGAQAIAHNLTVAPEFVIVKPRSQASSSWEVFPVASNNRLNLNAASAASTYAPLSSVTSTSFSYPMADIGWSIGVTYVAYLFATCPGVSKVGTYTGNGTTQAIACGFTGGARFVLIKRTDASGDWYVYDTARGMTVLTDPYLLMNSNSAETATLGSVITSTGGFTVNAAILAAINTNAATYIFLAIA